jgi:hypothetical protein
MKDLTRWFNWQVEAHPELGDYINLCYVVKGKKLDSNLLHKAFIKLINRNEYLWSERVEYIDYLSTV